MAIPDSVARAMQHGVAALNRRGGRAGLPAADAVWLGRQSPEPDPTSPTSASRCAKPLRRSGIRCRGCRRSAPLMTEQTPGPRPIETDGQRSYAWRAVMSLPLGITASGRLTAEDAVANFR